MKQLLIFLLLVPFVSFSQEELPPPPPPEEVPVKSEIIDFPEKEAQFPGGQDAMFEFIKDNLRYPEVALAAKTQGKVYVDFVVGKDGDISQIRIVRGVSTELDREAKRIVRSMPKWIPAEVNGHKVNSRCRLPIRFVLTE